MSQQRSRGRILTSEALSKLQQAIHAWEVRQERRCTQEQIRELTSAFKEGGLDPTTIGKMRKAKGGVDPESIRYLFQAFGLQLEETDLVASAQSSFQVDPNFVGREGAIADLNILVNRGVKLIVIQARGGVGKTTLARKFLQQKFAQVLEFPIAKETKDIASIESLIEEKLRQLGEEPGREFLVSIDRLKRKLQTERIGILIDNLEPALDSAGRLIEVHRRYVELLRVLADPSVRSTTLITSRERLHEPSVTVQHYPLRSLEVAAWEQFFQLRQLAADTPALAALHHAYGGNAKAMEILSSVIKQDYSEDIEAYWQENQNDLLIERDLEDLVTQQFDRLQAHDEDAYRLLCRMGCYRYQDVPTVPIEGLLCLLWDVPENRQKRVVRVLQERSMVDVKDGEYWLHPVIRGEAIGRLRPCEDWEKVNHQAAEFWKGSINLIEAFGDAIRAFEAYYHYSEIGDFQGSLSVIIERIPDKWGQNLFLGEVFNRLGLNQKILESVNRIIDITPPRLELCHLYRILGNANLIDGKIKEAIDNQEKARKIVDNLGIDEERRLYVRLYSLLSQGIYSIYLWELENSESVLHQVLEGAKTKKHERLYIKALCYLSFIGSIKGNSNSIILADETYSFFRKITSPLGSFTYHGQYLGLAYVNLSDFEKALKIYEQISSSFAIDGNAYLPTQGKALLLLSEIHRCTGKLKSALLLNISSISILEKVEAKSELAEAHYQLGLTYRLIGEIAESNRNLQMAVDLFAEMEAPKQVERVMRSMQSNL